VDELKTAQLLMSENQSSNGKTGLDGLSWDEEKKVT